MNESHIPRLGVEVEVHGLALTLRVTESSLPPTPATVWPVDLTHNLITSSPILIPLSIDPLLFPTSVADVPWTDSPWGLLAVGDSFQRKSGAVGGLTWDFAECILELCSSAQPVSDAFHWIFLRQCLGAFKEAVDELLRMEGGEVWFTDGVKRMPIHALLDCYNLKVDNLPLPIDVPSNFFPAGKGGRDGFKLAPSTDLLALQSGTHPSAGGTKWSAYVSLNPGVVPSYPSQITYQTPLATLYSDTEEWLALWSRMYISGVDPDAGHNNRKSIIYVYRNAFGQAMWRQARVKADELFPKYFSSSLPKKLSQQLKALIMIMLAMGSPTPVQQGTPKNSYPQLCKTSPASIATVLRWMGGVKDLYNKPMTTPTLAATDAAQSVRTKKDLTLPLGNAPGAPETYKTQNDPIFGGDLPDTFAKMWAATFSSLPLLPDNKFGYIESAPFYCSWAAGVSTSSPAAVARDEQDLLILWESRFDTNRMNMSFNPDCKFEMFYEGLVALGALVCTSKEAAAVKKALKSQPAATVGTEQTRRELKALFEKAQSKGVH